MVALLTIPAPPFTLQRSVVPVALPTTLTQPTHLPLTLVNLTLPMLLGQEPILVHVHGQCHQGVPLGPQKGNHLQGAGVEVRKWTSPFTTWRHSSPRYPSPRDQSRGQVVLKMRNLMTTQSSHENSRNLTTSYGIWPRSGSCLSCGRSAVFF